MMELNKNIMEELNLLLLNLPEDLSDLEKIRYIYIKTGELFCYDYNVANNPELVNRPINYDKDTIEKYQTCVQIANILNLILNNISPNCKCNIITRDINIRGYVNQGHLANEVILANNEKFLLDLTLDLYLIQSGCQTKHFGFETDASSSYDIISLKECEMMDSKLGLIKNGEYKDKEILALKEKLNNIDYSNMTNKEKLSFKINNIKSLLTNFDGYQESKLFINKLFNDLLDYSYKEYNFTLNKENNQSAVVCYAIFCDNEIIWYLYNNKLGLIETSPLKIKQMLNYGWQTNSVSLNQTINKSL